MRAGLLAAVLAAAVAGCQGDRAQMAGPPSPATAGEGGAAGGSGDADTGGGTGGRGAAGADAGGPAGDAAGPAPSGDGRAPDATSPGSDGAGAPDAGAPDAGAPDASAPDAGRPDSAGADLRPDATDATDAAAVETGAADLPGTGAGGSPAGTGGSAGTPGASGASGTAGAPGTGGAAGSVPPPPPPPPLDPLCAIDLRCPTPIVDDPKITCTLAIAAGDGQVLFSDHAGVELRGRTSLFFPKKNYGIELRDAAGGDAPIDLMGMGSDADWVLDGAWSDRSLMRGALIFDSFRDFGAGRWAPEGRFCRLSLNGQPQGIYRLVEKVERSPARLDIPADDGTGASFVVKQDDQGVLNLPIGIDSRWKLVDPDQDKATPAQLAGVQAWMDGLNTALGSAVPADPTTGVLAYLDLDSTVDWVLLEEFSKNIDGYNLSLHFVRERGGTARVVPWDLDLSFGQPTVTNELPGTENNDRPDGWIVHRSRLIQVLGRVPDLTTRLGPRWRALRAAGGPLSDAALAARLDAYGGVLTRSALAQNFLIWPLANVDYSSFYKPYTLYPVSSYDDEVAKLRAFMAARLAWIDAHVDAYPN